MVEGTVTTLTKANKNSESLRTTVPISIIKQFNLKDGGKISWIFEARDGDIIIIVSPVK